MVGLWSWWVKRPFSFKYGALIRKSLPRLFESLHSWFALKPRDKRAMLVVSTIVFTWKWNSVPRGEKRFRSSSPTWPWCHVPTGNIVYTCLLLQNSTGPEHTHLHRPLFHLKREKQDKSQWIWHLLNDSRDCHEIHPTRINRAILKSEFFSFLNRPFYSCGLNTLIRPTARFKLVISQN